ncbi:MAG: class I SAM-dependent methyltransferase, partial [Thermodesulfobacteriota bacterium]
MFNKILRPLTGLVRHILSKPDERGDLTSDLFRLKIRGRVKQLIKDNNGFLLDIGCGDGLLFETLLKNGNMFRCVGIDTEHEILETANERFRKMKPHSLNFLKAHAQNLPFPDKSIDIAICINTFYNFHTKDDVVEALEEMERVCKRDGFIIFDVRNKINPLVYLSFKFVWLY